MKIRILPGLLCFGLLFVPGGFALASDAKDALDGTKFEPLPPIDMPEGIEEFAKKNGLAGPKDIDKAMKECREEKKGPSCVSEKLSTAGFKVPPLPAGAKELDECIEKAKAGSNEAADTKACLDKYLPKGPAPKMEEKKEESGTNSKSAV